MMEGGRGGVRWRGGGGGGGGLSSLFFPFREHPLLSAIVPLCDSWSWQCEGENKNRARCPARVGGRIGRHPSLPKANQAARVGGRRGSKSKAEHAPKLTQHFFFPLSTPLPPLTFKMLTLSGIQLQKMEIVNPFFFGFLEKDPSLFAVE